MNRDNSINQPAITYIVPVTNDGSIYKKSVQSDFVIGSTNGLCKISNEDRIGYKLSNGTLRVCLADGHWGSAASEAAVKYWLNSPATFPRSMAEAITSMRTVEQQIYDKYGSNSMDSNLDRTPETSCLAIELTNKKLRIASYGDCRLLLLREGAAHYILPMHPTWLGAFSRLGLRSRLTVADATIFYTISLKPGDTIVLFTDGVDECIYDTPTLDISELASLATSAVPSKSFDAILSYVFAHGAEDNASLAIITI